MHGGCRGSARGARLNQGLKHLLRHAAGAHRLNQHTDCAATGQTNSKSVTIADAIFQHLAFALFQRLERFEYNSAFDTSTRNRAFHLTVRGDNHLRAHTAWCGPPGLDNCGKRRAAACFNPCQCRFWRA